ncbi:putative membrane protein [Desulfobaculum xiamenense]|uniref:Putative membrane protein n=1 Tax=Desulfobaculum xiamenense TaxID=995050 RepID=A0A846QQN9_9BACT|nr:DUF2079 domain-containing protein [Desulfobaculum xiamenense]NJB68673.1 putative membrane protein [Desulfobaculum xiamenense]
MNDIPRKAVPATLAAFLIMGSMAVLKHESLHASIADLGLAVAHLRDLELRAWWPVVFWGHCQPLKPIWAWFYGLMPDGAGAAALLVTQAALLCMPAAELARRHGWTALAAFILYFPLWFNGLFDFHPDHLAVPLLFGFLFAAEDRRFATACAMAMLLALVKEPFALQTAACGAYLLVKEGRGALPAALLLIVFGCGYFLAATGWLIPALGPASGGPLGSGAFGWMGSTPSEALLFMVTHPFATLGAMVDTPGKLLYLGTLFGALLFIPLLAPAELLPALPPLALALLSQEPNHYGIGHHYTAGVIAPLVMGFMHGLPRARKLLGTTRAGRHTAAIVLAALLLGHVALSPSPISRLFWTDKIWSYGWRAYVPTERDVMIRTALRRHLDGAQVLSMQNTLMWDGALGERTLLVFPAGVAQPLRWPDFDALSRRDPIAALAGRDTHPPDLFLSADCVVLDLKRPWHVGDRGCAWLRGRCTDDRAAMEFMDMVDVARRDFATVFENDGFLILRRDPAQAHPARPAGRTGGATS